jgi:ABC-type amino acid transport substrate-binding protein
MKLRKWVAVLAAGMLALSLALVGCGSTAPSSNSGTPSDTGGSSTNEESDTTGAQYVILDEPLSTEHYGVGFRLADTDLRDVVEATLVEMYKDGFVSDLAAEFAADGINYDSYILTSTTVTSKPALERTTFAVGFDAEFPPYGYLGDNGEYTGFDLKLATEVASRNGWEIKLVPISWDAKDLELNSGNIDCIWNGFTIEGREDQYTWTKPYMDNSQVIVVKASSGIKTFADLAGKVVMAQADSAALHLLESDGDQASLAATFKELRSIPDYNTSFMELDQGSVDAVAIDQPVAEYQIATRS